MAKSAKGKSKQKSQSHITRITAGDKATKPKKPSILATAKELAGRAQTEKSSAKTTKSSAKAKTAASSPKNSKSRRNPLSAITGYFRGAWQEIKQVRWPDRRSTWGMVGALIVFTAALFLVIILLDYGFAWLFKLIMGTK
ncbi:preprotein translocase subunit SecE [Candidatus Saccharibacteria bacterium]|nr:preprotein translocase subunit SecE [Candidatus Saccharibacteria bacterium]